MKGFDPVRMAKVRGELYTWMECPVRHCVAGPNDAQRCGTATWVGTPGGSISRSERLLRCRQMDQIHIKGSRVGLRNPSAVSHALNSSTRAPATVRSSTTMLFSRKLFAALLAVATVGVAGSPSPVGLEKRDPESVVVRYCEGEEFGGSCRSNPTAVLGQCYTVDTPGTPHLSQVGTFEMYGDSWITCGFFW
jgi:hypothetical protein